MQIHSFWKTGTVFAVLVGVIFTLTPTHSHAQNLDNIVTIQEQQKKQQQQIDQIKQNNTGLPGTTSPKTGEYKAPTKTSNKTTTQTVRQSVGATKIQASFAPNLCVTPKGGRTQRGTPLILDDCSRAMVWSYDPGKDEMVLDATKFVKGGKWQCLDVKGANAKHGTPIQLYDCNRTNAQKWDARKIVLTDDRHHVVNAIRGFCLDAAGGKLRRGANMIVWDCHGGQNQVWSMKQ